jgi:hypothetical protein
MFAKQYPAYHPRKGELTLFVHKILCNQLRRRNLLFQRLPFGDAKLAEEIARFPKGHTIRAGHHWKVGDKFSARTWQGLPYRSKQQEFLQLTVAKIWNFAIDENGVPSMGRPGEQICYITDVVEEKLAANDGLEWMDFQEWLIMPCFRKAKRFEGQVICWDETIDYHIHL